MFLFLKALRFILSKLARQAIDTKDQKLDKLSDPYDANKLRSYVPRWFTRKGVGGQSGREEYSVFMEGVIVRRSRSTT